MILFCVPYAGGGKEVFDGVEDLLGPGVEVRVADLPGRGARYGEPLDEDMAALTARLAAQAVEFADEPFALFGYSFGAVVAHALAVELEGRGRVPRRLFAGAARAPHLGQGEPVLHVMSDTELVEELRSFEGTTYEVLASPELLSIYLPIIRADSRVMETYRPPRRRLSCPVTAFGGTRDHRVATADLAAWMPLGGAGSEVRVFEGGHFVLHSRRARVWRAVRADLALDAVAPVA
ncbi:thioesterase II family protein [Actinokineospora sp. G85]|uniref:thioesterase II family protein n=1 Tax=Actinokineospora sp. G85 TaxID=3406626 RepID=UPI003C73893D